jgi:outer membrane protein
MKNASLIISSLALVGVLVLLGLHFSGDKKNTTKATSNHTVSGNTSGRIAYVNIDTLEAHYEYLKNKKDEFTKRQASMKAELERSAQQLQNDVANVQRKAQAGTLTEAEYKAADKRVAQMQQSLQAREAALTQQLLKEQEDFNKELKSRLDVFLAKYNEDKHFDYILAYSDDGRILYTNKDLDITDEVIKGMNSTANQSDTTKKK